ncbi:MAG: TRAP-type transport system small permease protein [Clostridiales bacterium]|jgi:TRAP-type C4-dicarboxylate transport system permease small subunit|nr:TRAP-type transport system small permease protein [Clostridiales bacterium]
MKSLKAFFDKLVLTVTSTLFGVMVIIVFMQVIFRYVFQNSLSWSEEVARYIFVWLVFLGAGYVLGQNAHVNLDAVVTRLPKTFRLILSKVNAILLFAYSFIITRYGFELFKVGMRQRSSALQIPMHIIYIVLPVSGVLLMFYSIYKLFYDEGR